MTYVSAETKRQIVVITVPAPRGFGMAKATTVPASIR